MAVAHVNLCDLRAGTVSGIGDFEVHLARLVRGWWSNAEILVGKGRVGKTIPKRKKRFHSRLVITPVADEHTLGVRHLLVPGLGIVGVMRGILLPAAVE